MDSFSSEATTNVMALLDGFNTCLFDGVSSGGMEVCNQVRDGLWDVSRCCACCVLSVVLYNSGLWLYLVPIHSTVGFLVMSS